MVIPPGVRQHFLARARGSELSELVLHLQGRDEESGELAWWLRTASTGMFVATGRAGCGKSALLGRMVTLADRPLLAALEEAGIMRRPLDEELPPDNVFDVVIHLTGKTVRETI